MQLPEIESRYYPLGQAAQVFVLALYKVFSPHYFLQTPFPSVVASKKYPVLQAVH
jgi:hypothetical protein